MIMKVDRKAALKKLKNLVLSPKIDIEDFKLNYEKTLACTFLPNQAEKEERKEAGIDCDLITPEIYSSNKIIFYIHGGFFIGGSCNSYSAFCASLATAASSRIFIPEFRLAPKHTFPASIDDIENSFRALYAEQKDALSSRQPSMEPEFYIAADGSGASLALALLFRLGSQARDMVKGLLLFSPWLDLSPESPLLSKKTSDELLSSEALIKAADLYTYNSNTANAFVSPLRAKVEDFKDFPPVFIQVGEKEMLLQQSALFDAVLDRAGIDCKVDVWPDMMYMFQFADEYLNESHLAVERAGLFVKEKKDVDKDEEQERMAIMKKNNIAIN